jgi:hypothetical protein
MGNFKRITLGLAFMALLYFEFVGLAFALLFMAGLIYVFSELIEFATTDPLAWEERQRQKQFKGEPLLSEVRRELRNAKKVLTRGDHKKAAFMVDSLENRIHEYSGPLDRSQKDEHQLISNFRLKHNIARGLIKDIEASCSWCQMKSNESIYQCPECGFKSASTTSIKGLMKHWKNKHGDCCFPSDAACGKHEKYRMVEDQNKKPNKSTSPQA